MVVTSCFTTALCPLWVARDSGRNFPRCQFANFYGQGHVVSGQGRLLVLSGGNHYGDVDKGDTIWYSSTDSKDETLTENTRRMLDSITIFVVGFQSSSSLWAFNHHLRCRLSITISIVGF